MSRWLVLFLALWIGSAHGSEIEKLTIRTTAPIPTLIVFPDNVTGKVPVMILLHGSTGIHKDREWVYAKKFAEMGIATVIVDLFTPRNIKSTADNQDSLPSATMTKDAIAILQVVAKNPRIDAQKIGLMGFSKGAAATVRAALEALNRNNEAQFALFIALYPDCANFRYHPKTTGKPIHLLLGSDDHWTGWETCIENTKIFKEYGADITAVVIPHAEHGWDVPGSAHYTFPNAENYSRCRFIETRPQIWIESTSGIVMADEHGPTKDRKKALSKCVTRGTTGGYSAKATAESWALIEKYVSVLK